jgi:hypothetical protein
MNGEQTFTLKHVNALGEQTLWPGVTRVAFVPGTAFPAVGGKDTVFADMASGTTGSFDSGTVYVLNAAGRTVDIYRLEMPLTAGIAA